MRIIYSGGFMPDLAIDDDKDSRYWGWLMAKNPADGRWVSLANMSLQITNAVFECEPSEIEALCAKLAECQAVIRSRGHDADCPVTQCCKVCGTPKMWTAHRSIFDDYPEYHEFEPGPCSDTCGHDRTTGEKA